MHREINYRRYVANYMTRIHSKVSTIGKGKKSKSKEGVTRNKSMKELQMAYQ